MRTDMHSSIVHRLPRPPWFSHMQMQASVPVMACVIGLLVAPPARAQFAVIDIGAITQLITEVEILEDQLTTARAHLAQAQAEYESITGGRGMEALLSGA